LTTSPRSRIVPRDLDGDSVASSYLLFFPYQGRRRPLVPFERDMLLDRG